MAQNEISDYDEVDDNNVDIAGVDVQENVMRPPAVNNAFRRVQGALKRWFKSSLFRLRDSTDQTKLLALGLSGITTATTRTLTVQDTNGTIAVPERLNGPSNLGITATVAANALTISIKGVDGNDPSAGNPVFIPFRSVTASSGDVEVLSITAATSLVVSSGSTLGTTSGVASSLVVVGFNDGGTFRLGVINPTSLPVKDGIASSTAEGGAGGADSAATFYTGTAVTSKAYTVLGVVTSTQATAGTWATTPATVQVGNDASIALQVPQITAWAAYTPTFTAMGTATNVSFFWRRVGDTLEIMGKFNTGVVAASEARISLPSGLTVDNTKVPSIRHCGTIIRGLASSFTEYYPLATGSNAYLTIGNYSTSDDGLASRNGDGLFANGDTVSVNASIPITGW